MNNTISEGEVQCTHVVPAPYIIKAYVRAVSMCLARDGDAHFLDSEVMRGLGEYITLLAEIRVNRLNRASSIDSLRECG